MPLNMFLSKGGTLPKPTEDCDEYCGLSWCLEPSVISDTAVWRDEFFDWGWFYGD